ncbi:hypothetical protein RHGRI_014954 [Rhododendron griersonianum]|uniref:Photolyase/cryptochrome alpha/beta domain-containing protein n=1 Tax=Rhododendron griersonianum TaxID=479676 RepID=A0AAV6KBE3_9ERIC|nr:hypothetical protein RHGRI_014954 [Rhododendron griersonianum]
MAEEKIEEALKDEGVELKYFWGSTLYHVDDLPFKLEEMPTNYSGFKEKMQGLEIRKTIEALDRLKGLPSMGDIEDGKPAANASLVGGETEALQKLTKFVAECPAQPNNGTKNGNNDSIYGSNFSCKMSPWLSYGCLSPRSMFDELKKSVSRTISAASNQKDGGSGPSDTGMHWLMYELLWRDFFRFITKKYSARRQQSTTPVTAYAGATA